MGSMRRTCVLLLTVAGLGTPVHAQTSDISVAAGGPFSRQLVLNAPFSADATTHIQRVLPDGTTRADTLTAHYYRDSQGRVRAELDTQWGTHVIVQTPVDLPAPHVMFYTLDLQKRTYGSGPPYSFATRLFNGEGRTAIPLGSACFYPPLPPVAGASDDERLRAVNAQVAEDLGIVTASRRSDGIATVDYKVTNIRRGEPSAQLFDLTDFISAFGSPDSPTQTYAPWTATSCINSRSSQ